MEMDNQTLTRSDCSSRTDGPQTTLLQKMQNNSSSSSNTSERPGYSVASGLSSINEPEYEPVKVWKQLSKTEKALENALNDVVESATDLQRDLAVLLTKMSMLFDPDIVGIISNNILEGKSSQALGNGEENSSANQEVDNEWSEKLSAFDKLKLTTDGS